jgi:hypothetical protein
LLKGHVEIAIRCLGSLKPVKSPGEVIGMNWAVMTGREPLTRVSDFGASQGRRILKQAGS